MSDDDRRHYRFDMEANLETGDRFVAALWVGNALMNRYWDFNEEKKRCSMGGVEIPDTSRMNDIDDVEWSGTIASANNCAPPPDDYMYSIMPFAEPGNRNRETNEPSMLAMSGEATLSAFQAHGEIGMYQHLLWSSTVHLLAGLDTGPVKM